MSNEAIYVLTGLLFMSVPILAALVLAQKWRERRTALENLEWRVEKLEREQAP